MKKYLLPAVLLTACTAMSTSLSAQLPRDPVPRMIQEVSKDSLEASVRALVHFGTRHTLSNRSDTQRGLGAAQQWVLHRFQEYAAHSDGRMKAELDTWQQPADNKRINRPVTMANVMAMIKGDDDKDDRIFIVTAHLDSRRSDVMDSTGDAPGANDDGSGVAALLEMARVMSRQPFHASILLVAVSGEEQGLFGSEHLAAAAQKSQWNVPAMLNNDMIGQSTSSETDEHDNTKVRVFSEGVPAVETQQEQRMRKLLGGGNDSRSRELARYIKAVCEQYVDNLDVKLIYRPDRFLRGGDHLPFQQRGYAAVRITDFYENFDHQHQDIRTEHGIVYGDLQQFMDFEYLRKNTCLNLAVLASLANAPSVPQHAKIDISRLTNYTRLYWQAPAYGKAAGYYVLMRETDAPMWQKEFYTTGTELTVPYSKDNYFFAVQAVGENGMRSLPVFPGIGN